jgi:dTDP-4-dehydrorhamnose 3,5-epimerase
MHFQYPPHAEVKIVTCLRGRVWDVAVDLRIGSKTFLDNFATELFEGDETSYVIPEGVAHGFQTLTDDCELLYFHTADYKQESEGAVNAFDPKLAIPWPRSVTDISDRDRDHPMIQTGFLGLNLT